MIAPAIQPRLQCHYCSRFQPRYRVLQTSAGGVRVCDRCLDWHYKAVRALGQGAPPPGCQECGITFRELSQRTPDGNTRMSVIVKDGIYQILCPPCADAYIRKRTDLFKGTPFAHSQKL